MNISKEEKADLKNIIVAARGSIRRIIVWHSRLNIELARLEKWIDRELKEE